MTKEEYTGWMRLAQQTAWVEYMKINPRAHDLLIALVRNFLDSVDDTK